MSTDTQPAVAEPAVVPSAPARAAKPGLYQRFRRYMQDTPWLFHVLRTIRFTAMVGPWRPLLVAYWRRFNRNPPMRANGSTLFPEFDPVQAAEELARDGFASGLQLPENYVREILEWCGPCEPHINKFNFHLQCAAADAVVHDPKIIETARRYLGVEPTFIRTDIWSSKPRPTMQHGNRFHFDVPDVQSMTVFFYLTDVDEDGGPHVVIRGTHRRKTLLQCARIYLSDECADEKYGRRVLKITGRRGTGFCEEQTILHKGMPTKRYRLLFSAIYGLRRQLDLP